VKATVSDAVHFEIGFPFFGRDRMKRLMSAFGTKRTSMPVLSMSAFEGKTDIADFHSDVR